MKRTIMMAAALTLLVAVAATAADIAIPLPYRNSTYNGSYNPTSKVLSCSAANPQGTWNSQVAGNIPSIGDIAASGTAYGPLFIYSQPSSGDYRVDFCMLQWQTGQPLIPGSNTPLQGTIGNGRLVYANFALGTYGAQVNVVAQRGGQRWLYRWDISQGGCKEIASPTPAPPVQSPPPPQPNTISGRVTKWVGGSPTSWPTEQGLRGVKVIIGKNLWLDIGDAFTDYVRSQVGRTGRLIAEVETNADGSFSVAVDPANAPYDIILWKQWWVPSDAPGAAATIPATYSDSLQQNALEAGGKHSQLRYADNVQQSGAGAGAGDAGRTLRLADGKFTCQVPQGFSVGLENSSSFGILGPEKTGIVGIGVPEPVSAAELPEFATEVVNGLAPEFGISDLQVRTEQALQIAPGVPGLMRVASGTLNDKSGGFAFLVFSTQTHSYVLMYAGQAAVYDKYFPRFEALLQSVRFN